MGNHNVLVEPERTTTHNEPLRVLCESNRAESTIQASNSIEFVFAFIVLYHDQINISESTSCLSDDDNELMNAVYDLDKLQNYGIGLFEKLQAESGDDFVVDDATANFFEKALPCKTEEEVMILEARLQASTSMSGKFVSITMSTLEYKNIFTKDNNKIYKISIKYNRH